MISFFYSNKRIRCLLLKKIKKVYENQASICFIDCSLSSEKFPLQVLSTSSDYNAAGEFYCANGGTLFDSNKTRLNSNKTFCSATAQWNGHRGLNCFTGTANVIAMVNKKGTISSKKKLNYHNLRLRFNYGLTACTYYNV